MVAGILDDEFTFDEAIAILKSMVGWNVSPPQTWTRRLMALARAA